MKSQLNLAIVEIQRAMKTILKKSLHEEDQEKLFAEMHILKNLDHPNIVKLYELFEDELHYYLITEFCLLLIIYLS